MDSVVAAPQRFLDLRSSHFVQRDCSGKRHWEGPVAIIQDMACSVVAANFGPTKGSAFEASVALE